MRVARTKQGAMRVALTMVVAVLAVLAEPVLGETQLLTGKTVTTSRNGVDVSAIVDGAFSEGSPSAAIFNDNNDNKIEEGAANPWVQIDFGEGNQATIGDVRRVRRRDGESGTKPRRVDAAVGGGDGGGVDAARERRGARREGREAVRRRRGGGVGRRRGGARRRLDDGARRRSRGQPFGVVDARRSGHPARGDARHGGDARGREYPNRS